MHKIGYRGAIFMDIIQKKRKKAFYWAEQTYLTSCGDHAYNLGEFYLKGIGVEQDIEKGISLYKEAANHKDNDAIYQLARFYEEGKYVEKDIQTSKNYYEKLKYTDY